MRGFWEVVLAEVQLWTFEALDGAGAPEMKARNVIAGEDLAASIGQNTIYGFNHNAFPGFCGLILDPLCLQGCAARRLEEDRSAVSSMSPVLMKLVCEEPAADLRNRIVQRLLGQASTMEELEAKAVAPDPSFYDADKRYLQYTCSLPVEQDELQVTLLFDLAIVREKANAGAGPSGSQSALGGQRGIESLHRKVLHSMVDIHAIVHRFELSLGACVRMQPGQIIQLPEMASRNVTLNVATLEGSQDIAEAALGTIKANRAVKLNTNISEDFICGLSAMAPQRSPF